MTARTLPSLVLCALMAFLCGSACAVQESPRTPELPSVESDVAVLSHASHVVDSARSRVLVVADEIMDTYDIAILSGKLFLTTPDRPPYIRVFDATSGAHLRTFGRDGEGPGEFQHGLTMLQSLQRAGVNLIWLRHARSTFTSFNADELPGDLTSATTRSFRPQFSGGRRFAYVDSGRFIATGDHFAGNTEFTASFKSKVALGVMEFSDKGMPLGSPTAIAVGDPRIPEAEIRGAYEHIMCVQPSGQRLVLAYKLAGRVDIVERGKGTVSRAVVPLPFPPQVGLNPQTGRTGFWPANRENRAAYMDCTASDHHIFALFSGRRVRDFPGRSAIYSQFVHVFDWTGQLVRILKLDHFAPAIAVDRAGALLFSVDHNGPNDRGQIRVTPLPP